MNIPNLLAPVPGRVTVDDETVTLQDLSNKLIEMAGILRTLENGFESRALLKEHIGYWKRCGTELHVMTGQMKSRALRGGRV